MEISVGIKAELKNQGLEPASRVMDNVLEKCLDSFFIGLVYASAKSGFKSMQLLISE